MPLKLQILSNNGAPYVGWAKEKLHQLTKVRKQANLKTKSQNYLIPNSIYIRITSSDYEDIITIWEDLGRGFISKPRLPEQNAGWKINTEGKLEEVLVGMDYEYPLVDDVGTSRAILLDDNNQYEQDFTPQMYGNIDWIGINTAEEGEISNAPVLTWKGPPGRTLNCDFKTKISGLTSPDISFDGNEYVTCFSPNIYSSGEILNTIPTTGDVLPKVLGCAIQGEWLVAIVNNHYGDSVGFFNEVWFTEINNTKLYDKEDNPKGWQKIDSQVAGRPVACWFFNQSGTCATQGLVEYTIDLNKQIVNIHTDDITQGMMTLFANTTTSTYKIEHAGTWTVWSDYKGDERVFAVATISGGDETKSISSSTSTNANVYKYTPGVLDATVTVSISGNQASATITGTHCPCTGVWSISNGSTISQSGVIDKTKGCGTATVTYTCEGLVGTALVKLDTGTWVRSACYRQSQYTEEQLCSTYGTFSQTIGGGAGDLTKRIEEYCCYADILTGGEYVYMWNDTTQACTDYVQVGTHWAGCLPGILEPTGYSNSCSSYVDPHGCFIIDPWNCTCCAVVMAEDFVWGCADDTPVPSC